MNSVIFFVFTVAYFSESHGELRKYKLLIITVVNSINNNDYLILATIIKRCPRNLENINLCIINSIEMLRPNLVMGNLGDTIVPKLDPLFINEIKISNGNDLNASFKNLSVFGPSKFTLMNLQ